MNNICIHTGKGKQQLSFENIVRIESKSNYCKIFCTDKTYPLTVAKVLCWFEQQLPADIFFKNTSHTVGK